MLMTEWTDGCMRDSRLRGNCADPAAGCWSFNQSGNPMKTGEKICLDFELQVISSGRYV